MLNNKDLFYKACDDIFDSNICFGGAMSNIQQEIVLTDISFIIYNNEYKYRSVNKTECLYIKRYPILKCSKRNYTISKNLKNKTLFKDIYFSFEPNNKTPLKIIELNKSVFIYLPQNVMDFIKTTNKRKFKIEVSNKKRTYLICDKLNKDGSYRINKISIEN